MKHLITRFWKNSTGNFAVITALCLVPMIAFVGMGIDFSMANRAKVGLDSAADAAALAALNAASAVLTRSTATFSNTGDYISQGQAAGTAVFNANAARFAKTNPSPIVTVSPAQGLSVTANVTYTAQSPNAFGKIVGLPYLSISGAAAASFALPKYIEIFVVADISNSMGIGASPADMTVLYNKTGCQFGCHIGTPGQTNEDIAHANNVTLRIDVVKSAILNMISKAQATNAASGTPYIRIGLYTMENDLKVLSAPVDPNANFSTLTQLTRSIDLGTNGAQSADTIPQVALNTLISDPLLQSSGDGSSASSPQKFVYVMTDGTFDFNGACGQYNNQYNHCIDAYSATATPPSGSSQPLPTLCAKFRNVSTLGFVHTQYYPIYKNNKPPALDPNYDLWITPIANKIPVALQNCSSSGYYYLASDGPSIDAALNSLFAQAISQSRLTN